MNRGCDTMTLVALMKICLYYRLFRHIDSNQKKRNLILKEIVHISLKVASTYKLMNNDSY